MKAERWNRTAAECYAINCNCKLCEVRNQFTGPCFMKEAVARLISKYGEPDKEGNVEMSDDKKAEAIENFRKKIGAKYVEEANKMFEVKSPKVKMGRPSLTKSERAILRLLCLSDEVMAKKLGINDKTLRVHISNMYKKLDIDVNAGINPRAMAIVIGIKKGFINVFDMEV